MNSNDSLILDKFKEIKGEYEHFQKRLINDFLSDPRYKDCVHSVRYRTKSQDHLLEKIHRKNRNSSDEINSENLCDRITDIVGIRILHLHLDQFEKIHRNIMESINNRDIFLYEAPKAYTWDVESKNYFERLELITELKESYYTSVHYVLKPRQDSHLTCEVQVRTLLEEAWGEIDHSMNYPSKHHDEYCQAQLKVLARLVNASGHLANSIMKQYKNNE
jgi:Uncharacterized protein conserved in bacteria